ncbi:MAG: DUF3352 domain-containing protein [Flavobacteriales bacterium]|nr:DUF3352 domain-containing protein [Flavobacteriales bacterium]
MKKFLIILFIFVLISSGGAWFYFTQMEDHTTVDPQKAIPVSAALIISYPDIGKAWESFGDQDYFDVLSAVAEVRPFFLRNAAIDSLLRRNKDIGKMLYGATLWSSYHQAGGDSLHVFHVIGINTANEQRAFETVKRILNGAGVLSEQLWGETNVLKLVSADPFFALYCTIEKGLILVSSDEQLLRTSLSQLADEKSLNNDPYFVKATASAGKNVEADLYINYAQLPSYLRKYLNADKLNGLGSLASWTELDLNLKKDGLTFNGFTYSNDSLPQLLNLFLGQSPQSISFPEILPSNTASFLFFGLDDPIAFSSDYRKLLERDGSLSELEATLDSLNAVYGMDLEQNLLAWIGNEFGSCVIEPSSSNFTDETYFVFKARSSELAKKLLGDLSATLAEKQGVESMVGDLNGVEVRKLELSGILSGIFGAEFSRYENLFYMIYNDHVIMATTQNALAEFLRHIEADRTLAKELAFSEFVENLSSTFNVFSYHHLARSKHMMESYLNRDALIGMNENVQVFGEFEAIGSQLTSTRGGSFYSNVFLKYDPDQQSSTGRTHWTAQMSDAAINAPTFVKNHLSGEWEILVQDKNNALYLFNSEGKELFRVELSESIQSRPKQIDAFKNGKLQYIFNTENFIYLIDRSGNDVEGFPIKLAAAAETDLTVVNYDGKRDYRLLITCKNKRIYNYNIKGKKIKGWKHTKAADPTIQPFLHLFADGKDYLITGESNGKIHLLDRRGKNRLKVKKRVVSSKNNTLQGFRSSEKAFTGIYLTDETGKIHRVSLDGEVLPMDLGRFSPEHRFLVADLDKDGRPEFIFIDLNILKAFNYKKEKVFEKRLDPTASEPFLINLGENGRGIGFCYKDAEQLVLFNSKGEMVSGFPLSGISNFDMVKSGEFMLVVSSASDSSLSINAIP